MTNSDQRHILIAGGGIAGIAAAIALARTGWRVSIFEQRASPTTDGAGIQLGPNAVRCLRALGAADTVSTTVAAPDHISVRRIGTAETLATLPLGTWIEARHGAPYWTTHRADLYASLRSVMQATPGITEHVDTTLVSWSQDITGVRITTATSSTGPSAAEPVRHDGIALILADGIWSQHRAPDALAAAGKIACRAIIETADVPPEIDANATGVWLGRDQHVVHYPIRGGRQTALVVIFDEADAEPVWDRIGVDATVAARTANAAAPLKHLISRAPHWSGWSLYEDDARTPWQDGRVLRIGDAAHPILPFFAQGGAMALEDAVVLGVGCAGKGDMAPNFAAFEKQRRSRIARVADASRNNGRTYHMSGLAGTARDTALRLVPGTRLMARYDWLYGWTPPRV